jgi:hypothetical protein
MQRLQVSYEIFIILQYTKNTIQVDIYFNTHAYIHKQQNTFKI